MNSKSLKSRKKALKSNSEMPQLPGYYFDKDKNRYFKIETNASVSASSQRSIQEKDALKERYLKSESFNIASKALKRNQLGQYSKLLSCRSIQQIFPNFERIASEIGLRNVSRRKVYSMPRSVVQQSCFNSNDSRLMMLTTSPYSTQLISLQKDESSESFTDIIHYSYIDGRMPSWILSHEKSLIMTFLESDTPIQIWNSQNDTLDIIFSGMINRDIWSCCVDFQGNVCVMGNKTLYRVSRVSSDVSRSCQSRVCDELGASDAICMASFSTDLVVTGHRNGYIGFFDSRNRKQVSMVKEKSSIGYLKPFSIHNPEYSDYYFLSSNMGSEINLYDTRLMKVIQSFSGHVNTHHRLKCDIFKNNILISPGCDNFIRGWSLSNGALLWQKLIGSDIDASPSQLSLTTFDQGFFTCQADTVSYWK